MSARKLCLFATLSLLWCSFGVYANGQDDATIQHQVINDISRLQKFFRLARRGFDGSEGFEATLEQQLAFDKFEERLLGVKELIVNATSQTNLPDWETKFRLVVEKLNKLKTKLIGDILSPHQISWLKKAEFEALLQKHNGDFAKVVHHYYRSSLKVTEKQRLLLDEAHNQSAEKKREALATYKKRIRKIEEETTQSQRDVFTQKQLELLDTLTGKLTPGNHAKIQN